MKNLEEIKLLAEKLPKEVKDNATALIERMGSVIEGIGDTPIEWRPEILKILQGTSDRAKYGKTTPIGALIVGEDVLEQPLDIIPIRSWKGRQYWSPDQTEAKMICSSPDAVTGYIGYACKECPHSQWVDGKSECSTVVQAAVITADLSRFFIVNFSKTAYATGTDWLKTMAKQNVAPFKRMYAFTTETHKQYKNVEALVVTSHKPSDKKTPEEYYEFLQALFNRFTSDREEHLTAFTKMALERKGRTDALLVGHQNAEQAVLTDSSVTVEAAPASEGQATLSKRYAM